MKQHLYAYQIALFVITSITLCIAIALLVVQQMETKKLVRDFFDEALQNGKLIENSTVAIHPFVYDGTKGVVIPSPLSPFFFNATKSVLEQHNLLQYRTPNKPHECELVGYFAPAENSFFTTVHLKLLTKRKKVVVYEKKQNIHFTTLHRTPPSVQRHVAWLLAIDKEMPKKKFNVAVTTDQGVTGLYKKTDSIYLEILSETSGYIQIYILDPDGQFYLLLPNNFIRESVENATPFPKVEKNKKVLFPNQSKNEVLRLGMDGKKGLRTFLVTVSARKPLPLRQESYESAVGNLRQSFILETVVANLKRADAFAYYCVLSH